MTVRSTSSSGPIQTLTTSVDYPTCFPATKLRLSSSRLSQTKEVRIQLPLKRLPRKKLQKARKGLSHNVGRSLIWGTVRILRFFFLTDQYRLLRRTPVPLLRGSCMERQDSYSRVILRRRSRII